MNKLRDERIKRAIIERIKKSLDYELYENQENTCFKDDYELEVYRDKIQELSESYYESIECVNNSDVVEMNDNNLKEQILNSKFFKKNCECIDLENMELYNLVKDGEFVEVIGNNVSYVFCKKCEKYLDRIFYIPDEK